MESWSAGRQIHRGRHGTGLYSHRISERRTVVGELRLLVVDCNGDLRAGASGGIRRGHRVGPRRGNAGGSSTDLPRSGIEREARGEAVVKRIGCNGPAYRRSDGCDRIPHRIGRERRIREAGGRPTTTATTAATRSSSVSAASTTSRENRGQQEEENRSGQ